MTITQQLYTYRALHRAEKSQGNLVEALRYAESEIALNEIIEDEQDKQDLILMKAKLYSQKREMELTSLKEKAKLDQLALAKKKQRNRNCRTEGFPN